MFINKYATDYLTQWHAIRKSDYLAIVVVDNEGALVLSSFPQVGIFSWKESLVASGYAAARDAGVCERLVL